MLGALSSLPPEGGEGALFLGKLPASFIFCTLVYIYPGVFKHVDFHFFDSHPLGKNDRGGRVLNYITHENGIFGWNNVLGAFWGKLPRAKTTSSPQTKCGNYIFFFFNFKKKKTRGFSVDEKDGFFPTQNVSGKENKIWDAFAHV